MTQYLFKLCPTCAGRPSVTHKKHHIIFAPRAGARSLISTKLCLVIEDVKSKRWQSFFDPTHSFAYRDENAYFWPLTHWANLNLPAGKNIQTPYFRSYSWRALFNLPQTLHVGTGRWDHSKRCKPFFHSNAFPTGCTENFGVNDRRAVSQQ